MANERISAWLNRVLPGLLLIFLPFLYSYTPRVWADGRIVKVGVYENAPKVFTDQSGRPAGIFIDVIEHIAEREGWNLQYIPGSWGEGLDRLANQEIDLMPDVAHTAGRETMYSFHKVPVLSSWFQVYARQGSGIRSILDLDGQRVVVLERSVQQDAFAKIADSFGLSISLISAPDYGKIFAMVAKGEADAAITNRFYGLMHAKKAGLEDTAVIFNPSDLFFAGPKNQSGQLLAAIDAHLGNLKSDAQSVYYESLKRWTSEQVRLKLPSWLLGIGLATGLILFMSVMGSVILKRQVNARTRDLSKRNKQLAIIDRTLRATTTELDLQAILQRALRGALALTKLEGGALCLLDRDSKRLVPGTSVTASGPIPVSSSSSTRIGECLCAAAVLGGKPCIHWDGAPAGMTVPLIQGNEEMRFHAAFPLQVRNEVIGVMCVYSCTDERPSELKLKLVQDICGPVALAIENARLYEQVLHHSEQLEQRVTERTEELAVAMERAQEADQLKSAFLATMSHELRTPLNSIIGFTGIMLQGLTGPLNEEQLKQMSMVQSSARHLLALINDVLDISKIEAGQLELASASFDLRSSLEKTVKLVAPQAAKKGIELKLHIAPDVSTVCADQRRLEQVFLNLLNNAVKFTEKGHVHIHCDGEMDHYIVAVSDTGIGIKQEQLPGLFQPFHQIDTGLARKHEGSGLGLSICKKLMDMMNGSISVTSEWGSGSTFTIRFPRNQEACSETKTSDH